MKKYVIGFTDIDPDTGNSYPFIEICTTKSEHTCNWIAGLLARDLFEHDDNPNREVTFKIIEE